MPPAPPHVLLLGGHGKVALLLTPRLLSRAWRVTSVVRDPAQEAAILEAAGGKDGPGRIDVLVESLEEVRSESDAARVLEATKPDYVVWSAGMEISLRETFSYYPPPSIYFYVYTRIHTFKVMFIFLCLFCLPAYLQITPKKKMMK